MKPSRPVGSPGYLPLCPNSMHLFRFRKSIAFSVVLFFGTALAACTDTKANARADSLAAALASANSQRDSIEGLMKGAAADKDRALSQVVEATKFADQIDAELRTVRGLSSKVTVNKSDESGKVEAAGAQKDILNRLTQLRTRLAARQKQVTAALDTLKSLRADSSATATLLFDLNTRLATREREIAAFQEEVKALKSQNQVLVSEKAVLSDTVKAMDVRENRVYFVVAPRRQLLADGLVTEEGGSRGFLIVKLGKTLVPSRTLDDAKFTRADRREVLTIPLPRSDRPYKVVSRHDVGLLEVAKKEKDGSFRGDAIRVTDPAKFWATSRYLIIAEK